MVNQNLLVSVDNTNTGRPVDERNIFRWSHVYAHGKFETDFGFDIVLFSQEMPTEEGYYIATADNNKTVVVHLVLDEFGFMCGRCCYIDDEEAMLYINSPEQWD